MRLCRFEDRYGLVDGDEVIDITDHVPAVVGLADPLVAAIDALKARGVLVFDSLQRRPLSQLALLSPVRRPSKILAAPNNYLAHGAEMAASAVGHGRQGALLDAGLFLKATSSLVGPSEGIAQRFLDRRTDHEVELVAIIGRTVAGPIEKAQALDCVAGYAVGLDVTLRGPEERSLRKSIDSYTVLGPWIVTADEVTDLPPLSMTLSVNDGIRQSTKLSDMVFDVAEQIAYASRFYVLYPGDLLYTGTPAGVGPIRPGDLLRAEIDKIGAMSVRVRAFGAT